jgi:hypothetical protein
MSSDFFPFARRILRRCEVWSVSKWNRISNLIERYSQGLAHTISQLLLSHLTQLHPLFLQTEYKVFEEVNFVVWNPAIR